MSWLISGIEAAIDGEDGELATADDADVLSMSLGGPVGNDGLADVIDYASDHAVVVSSAGNGGDGATDTNDVTYPAKYPGAIAVAATNQSDQTTTWSAEGNEVELAAPGHAIRTTWPDGEIVISGTSFAAPHVSGVAALVIAQDVADGTRDLSEMAVRNRLQNATLDIESSGIDLRSGHGLLLADDAVGVDSVSVTNFSVVNLSPGEKAVTTGETVDVSATVVNVGDAAGSQTVSLTRNGSIVDETTATLSAGETTTVTFAGVFGGLGPGTYAYGVQTANDSQTATLSVGSPPNFTVTALSPESISLAGGESFDVSATIENTGEQEGTQSVALTVDGRETSSRTVSLEPGETRTVTFADVSTADFEQGEYAYRVGTANDSRTGALTIADRWFRASVPDRVVPGENATIPYTLTNAGDSAVGDASFVVAAEQNGTDVSPSVGWKSDGLAAGASWTTNVTLAVDRDFDGEVVHVNATGQLGGERTSVNATIPVTETDVELHAPERITTTPGSSMNVSYTLENTGTTKPSAGGIFVASTTGPLSVNGSKARFLGFQAPVPATGESVGHSFTIDVPESTPPGTYRIAGQGVLGTEIDDWANTTVVVTEGLDRFDQNEPAGEIGFQDVLDAIGAYNEGETVGGSPVTFQDVLDVIGAYNSGS
ncbi:Halolysin protein [Halorhabdus tiamatea SARL4B]|nr:S8 family serine peptidase [Halorhabdus tiamatea]ERJ06872.1 Halolysin protein [Halorhabdus tiamatea SARL4B]